jgi:hypothetical protein
LPVPFLLVIIVTDDRACGSTDDGSLGGSEPCGASNNRSAGTADQATARGTVRASTQSQ